MENKPHDLEDKGLTGILERWAEGTGDPKGEPKNKVLNF